ncbi:hypothetical protein M408DRAFT_180400 [Serendipita vermifera MAFF 305830]|uniref:Uncharacterized protein n=1 Tax=Serendipita vermifera MAFF 305830 TaxID=933852 RepID=A0A0C3AKC9_SERVB|nr:hypothetical protein M408DRAFT_180449 [Serendipita vermifera MAFF 305830]KIM19750.1 hypothetical protein M408DRAFT_180400 [Serendipita vermifera MAFF 305830]
MHTSIPRLAPTPSLPSWLTLPPPPCTKPGQDSPMASDLAASFGLPRVAGSGGAIPLAPSGQTPPSLGGSLDQFDKLFPEAQWDTPEMQLGGGLDQFDQLFPDVQWNMLDLPLGGGLDQFDKLFLEAQWDTPEMQLGGGLDQFDKLFPEAQWNTPETLPSRSDKVDESAANIQWNTAERLFHHPLTSCPTSTFGWLATGKANAKLLPELCSPTDPFEIMINGTHPLADQTFQRYS